MALVKMVRDFPEVEGGNIEANIPEEAVQSAISHGWKLAESKSKSEEKREEIQKATVEPKVVDKVEEKKSSKVKNKRD